MMQWLLLCVLTSFWMIVPQTMAFSLMIVPSPKSFRHCLTMDPRTTVPQSYHPAHRSLVPVLRALSNNNNNNLEDDDDDDTTSTHVSKDGTLNLANDFSTFLNQCAIQSMVLLLSSVRDRQTALWLEDFTQPVFRKRSKEAARDYLFSDMAQAAKDAARNNINNNNNSNSSKAPSPPPREEQREVELLAYHGLAVMNTTLFPTWDSYFEKLLGQPDESYIIQSASRFVPDYDLEIKPASLCSRIISVREQIAREFVKDLDVIADMGGITLENYWERLKQQRNNNNGKTMMDSSQMNLLFLEFPIDEDSGLLPSPTRKGNFDLLVLLTTQESIHRLLNSNINHHQADRTTKKISSELSSMDRHAISFLRQFYLQRLPTHFTGNQWYGRADSILEELLSLPPSTIQLEDGITTALIDPMRLVELILDEREQIAEEWADQALDVPELHMQIKRKQLDRLMGIVPPKVEKSFE
jgi:hypothetical protein